MSRTAQSLALLGAVLAVTLGAVGCDLMARPAAFPALDGRIVWPKGGELSVLRLSDRQETRLVQLTDPSEVVTAAAWAPDGSRVVYAHVSRRAGARLSGSDLWVVADTGGAASLLVDRGEPTTFLDSPAWGRGGELHFSQRRTGPGGEQRSVARSAPDGSPPETVVDGAFSPSLFPDGSTITYLRAGRTGLALWKQRLDQTTPACLLVPETAFALISSHRASPDGSHVAFTASGEPVVTTGGTCGGSAAVPSSPPLALKLWQWVGLLPSPAFAHGLPADLWLINADGSNLRRLAKLQEDEAHLSWSPDGAALAVFGVHGLYAVNAASGEIRKLDEASGFGALDWAR